MVGIENENAQKDRILTIRLTISALLLSVFAIAALAILGLPPGHSAAFNIPWSTQYADAVSWSNPMPRRLPELWAGFGGHDFFFYAPLPFWFAASVVQPLCAGCAPATALVLASAVFWVASGWAMFAFLRAFFPTIAAAVGGCVYAILPYHFLIDWFHRQAIGEFTAYAFLPVVALGIERLRRDAAGGWILSLGVAGVMVSHLPTGLLAGHVLGVTCLVLVVLDRRGIWDRAKVLGRIFGYALLGLMLSAFYWLPAIALIDSVSASVLYSESFEAWAWLFGRGEPTPNPRMTLMILVCFACALPLLLTSLLRERGPALPWIVVPALCVIVMNLAISEPIWRNWIISRVQFPWRMVSLLDLSAAVAVASLVASVKIASDRRLLAVAGLLALVPFGWLASTITYSQTQTELNTRYTDWAGAAEYLSPQMTDAVRRRLSQDVLTHYDQRAITQTLGAMADEFASRQSGAEVLERGPRVVTLLPDRDVPQVDLDIQYWEFWQAEDDSGRRFKIRPTPRFGTLRIVAPSDGFQGVPITVRLPFHWSERLGWAAAGCGLMLLIALQLPLRRQRYARSLEAPRNS